MARGISLHIGLNRVDPAHYDGWDGTLEASEFDAQAMNTLAQSCGFESSVLLTQQATANAIGTAIEAAAQGLGSGDFYLLTYSGHGGQVPDRNDEDAADRTDETWLAYDRQILDDELYALWAKFQPGVRIVVFTDSSVIGSSPKRAIGPGEEVGVLQLATRTKAEAQHPRIRAMPRDVMIATYRAHEDIYDAIQMALPSSTESDVGATVLLISGCQDDQLALDGVRHGLFTGSLLAVWAAGPWDGGYPQFCEAIRLKMPVTQQPSYRRVGTPNPAFEQQRPFMIG
jgi:metacaspase-1